MQGSRGRDLSVGIFVLIGLLAVAYLSIQVGGLSYAAPGGLTLRAHFDEIGGLTVRAPVVISGVKIGQVSAIDLDEGLRAQVVMDVDSNLVLPIDTSAAIRTAGILGDQFIALEPGAEEDLLVSGDELSFTESAFNIEKLVGTLVHNIQIGGSE
jgi:phospholipid/cholesterol/gamma-HCH transport system substrate-binding protein